MGAPLEVTAPVEETAAVEEAVTTDQEQPEDAAKELVEEVSDEAGAKDAATTAILQVSN